MNNTCRRLSRRTCCAVRRTMERPEVIDFLTAAFLHASQSKPAADGCPNKRVVIRAVVLATTTLKAGPEADPGDFDLSAAGLCCPMSCPLCGAGHRAHGPAFDTGHHARDS